MSRSAFDYDTSIPDAQARQMLLGAITPAGVDVFEIQVKTNLGMSAIARLARELVETHEIETVPTRETIPSFRTRGDFWRGT